MVLDCIFRIQGNEKLTMAKFHFLTKKNKNLTAGLSNAHMAINQTHSLPEAAHVWSGPTYSDARTCKCEWDTGAVRRNTPTCELPAFMSGERNTWRRDWEADAKKMGYTWGQLEMLAQDRDAWRTLVCGLSPRRGSRRWWIKESRLLLCSVCRV